MPGMPSKSASPACSAISTDWPRWAVVRRTTTDVMSAASRRAPLDRRPVSAAKVCSILLRAPPCSTGPFCLFVSLVNPHDIGFFPDGWKDGGYHREEFAALGIDLPPNLVDDLATKPKIQREARAALDKSAPLAGSDAQRDYVNFYAYLHKIVDQRITTILDALDTHGLTERTVVVRCADHGELGCLTG